MSTVMLARRCSGKYSEVIVIAFAMPPPIPTPVRNRRTERDDNDAAVADRMEKAVKAVTLPTNTVLRPTLSAYGAISRHPIKSPERPLMNTGVKFCRTSPHS
jgi:hypothetical protein